MIFFSLKNVKENKNCKLHITHARGTFVGKLLARVHQYDEIIDPDINIKTAKRKLPPIPGLRLCVSEILLYCHINSAHYVALISKCGSSVHTGKFLIRLHFSIFNYGNSV